MICLTKTQIYKKVKQPDGYFTFLFITRCRYLSSVNVSGAVPKLPAETVNLKLNVNVFVEAS